MTEPEAPKRALPTGDRVSNRYQIRALVGRGGMACVYRALDVSLCLAGLSAASRLATCRNSPSSAATSAKS